MASSLHVVSLKAQAAQERPEQVKLPSSEVHLVQSFADCTVFTNTNGVYKVTGDETSELFNGVVGCLALETSSSRLLLTSTDGSLLQRLLSDAAPPAPVPLPGPPALVRQVACGAEHCLALLQHGVVAAWGKGPALGLGDLISDGSCHVSEPTVIPGLRDVLSISAGAFHSSAVAISAASDTDSDTETRQSNTLTGRPETDSGGASDTTEGSKFKQVQVGLSSFLFRSETPERRRDFNFLEKLNRNVRRWSESLGSEDGRGSPASGSVYDQLTSDGVGSASSTPTDSVHSEVYATLEGTEVKSLPGMSWLESEMHNNICELAVDTDVWMWGSGKAGQLGSGKCDDVGRPSRLPNMPVVVKVACGFSHCLALTADSKVYLWGTYYKSRRALVPQLIDTNSCLVYDVAAGNCVSLLVGYITYRPDVFVLNKERVPVRKTELRQEGWPVAFSSTFSAPVGTGHCLVSLPSSPDHANLYEAVHELNFKLRTLFSHLHNLKLSFVDPFMHICTVDDDTVMSSRLILLLNSVSVLHRTTHSCVNLATLRCLSSLDRPWSRLGELAALERSLARQLDAFRFFCHTLCNATAWNTFDLMLRQHPAASQEALSLMEGSQRPSAQRGAAIRDAFTHLLMLVEMQHAQVSALGALCPEFAAAQSEALSSVAEVHRKMKENLSDALITCNMVQGLSAPVQAQLASRPARRMVLDSEGLPVSTTNKSGRASSAQRLILFSDALVLIAGSQVTAWPLSLVWIRGNREAHEEKLENSLELRTEPNGLENLETSSREKKRSPNKLSVHSFQVLTPDEMMTLYAADEGIRAQWFAAINREINRALSPRRSCSQIPPERRYGQYTFRSGPFRGCRYDGQWMRAMMHGEGQLTWPDNNQHRGRFRRGKITGLGTRELKSPARTLTGEWEDGMLHGFAKVNYDEDGLKSEYQGWFSRGVREGHGVLRSCGGYLYIGEWQADQQHGYGVEEDYSAFPQYRFFGEWRAGLKHGRGSMVTVTDKYLEGAFVNGEMRGQGRIVDADFIFSGQVINGKPDGRGQCIFKSNTGWVKLNGQCFGVGEGKLKFEGEVEWETLSPTEAITMNRQSVYRYQTEDVDPEIELPSRWNAILRHCEQLLGKLEEDADDDADPDRARDRAWSNLASIVLNARKRWRRGQRLNPDESRRESVVQPRWNLLECIPTPATALTASYVARAREYMLAAVEVAEHPLGLYLTTMAGLIKEAYLGMGTHPQLLRHAREDVWITAAGLYSLLRRLFPLLPDQLDSKVRLAEEEAEEEEGKEKEELCSVHFVGRDFVYAVLLPRVYPCLRTLYSTTLDAEEDAYRRTLRKHNRIADQELFTLLEISGDYRERLVSEYECVGDSGSSQPTLHYLPIVERMRILNSEEVSCPIEQLSVLMRAYDDTLELMVGPGQHHPSADDQVPVILFMLIRANINHLGATLSYIRDMTAFSCDCTRGITMYKFTTILGLYRHLVDRNGMLY